MTDSLDLVSALQQRMPPFSKLLGIQFITATPERVVAEMLVREELCTMPAILHGGAIMAFADTLGAFATVINLQEGYSTTTIESKTNFSRPGCWELKSPENARPCIAAGGLWLGRRASQMKAGD
jgi:acyl-coenzyme A thioesterase PaaI-like protein